MPEKPPSSRFLTSHQVAKLLHASPSAVLTWIDDGQLASYRTPGGHRRIAADALRRFLVDQGMPVPSELARPIRVLLVGAGAKGCRTWAKKIEDGLPEASVATAGDAIAALL